MTLLLFVEMDNIRKRVYETLLSCSCYTLTVKGLSGMFGPQLLHPLFCDCLTLRLSLPRLQLQRKGSNVRVTVRKQAR